MIVDDSADNRTRWKAALESASFRVLEADSRVEALMFLKDGASGIDLLVAGVMSGATARLVLRAFEVRPGLAIIIVANAANPVGIQDQLTILLEPLSDEALLGAVRALLSQ